MTEALERQRRVASYRDWADAHGPFETAFNAGWRAAMFRIDRLLDEADPTNPDVFLGLLTEVLESNLNPSPQEPRS